MSKCKILLIIVSALFISLSASEVILRLAGYDYSPLKLKEPEELVKGLGKTDYRLQHSYSDAYCVYDRLLIWRPIRNRGIFNAQGFRGKELAQIKHSYEYRVFIIGDSNACGPLNEPGWGEYLELRLREEGHRISVTNASCWGYTSYQGLRRFEEIIRYEPDLVLISFGANDAHRVKVSDESYMATKRWIPSIINKSRVVRLGVALIDALLITTKKGRLEPRVSLQDYKRNLERIISLADSNKIKVVLLTRPFIGESEHPLLWKNFAPDYNELIKQIAYKNKVGMIDIYAYFKDKEEYFYDESHFNTAGFRLCADIIYNYLRENLNGQK